MVSHFVNNTLTGRRVAGLVVAAGLATAVVGGAIASADTQAGAGATTPNIVGSSAIARKAGKGPVEYLPWTDPPKTPSTTATPAPAPK
jgi:hypothetical protein